jgi:molecular chaperone GrpE
MTKKEEIEIQKEDGEENMNKGSVSVTDESTGSGTARNTDGEATTSETDAKTVNYEKEEMNVTDRTEGEPVPVEKEEKAGHAEGKRKKISKEKELESKLKEQHDKYLRLSAEFDNYRKRMMKERIELTQYAGANILTKILPVLDDFERANISMKSTGDVEAVRQGIELIYNKFKDYLNQMGIKEIEALNQEFNTDFHDAVTKIPVQDDKLKGKVVDVIEKGYTLNDKVIRYSRVVVGE